MVIIAKEFRWQQLQGNLKFEQRKERKEKKQTGMRGFLG
jgi:hypothetical protein